MRFTVGLLLCLGGCSLLPEKLVDCTVLGHCDVPTQDMGPPSPVTEPFVLGQPDANTNLNRRGMWGPRSVALSSDGKLVVADMSNQRVLIWKTIPTQSGTPADVVLGQPDFSTFVPSLGGLTASSMNFPAEVATDGTYLAVAEPSNYRVLVWNPFPTTNFQPANAVLGQGSFSSALSTTAPSTKSFQPNGLGILGSKLYVADSRWHRVLTFDLPLPATGAAASGASPIGQADFTSGGLNGSSNPSTVGPSGFVLPNGALATASGMLFVADAGNNRVLGWNPIPTANTPANLVLGQPGFTSNSSSPLSASSMNGPAAVAANSTNVAVADFSNNRVLVWPLSGLSNGQVAPVLLGQPTPFTSPQNSSGLNAKSLAAPWGVALDANHLAVADYSNNRVLIWNNMPTNNQAADVVLGQTDLFSGSPHGALPVSAQKFATPSGLAQGAGQLFVVDQVANRVLIWPRLPSSASDLPTRILGQVNLLGGTPNAGGMSLSSLNNPVSVASDGTNLMVSECASNRVLIWNRIPSESGAPADLVLGQPNPRANTMGVGAGMACPSGIYLAGGALYVADRVNHRVLIWNTLPTADYQPADVVLGQTDLNGNSPNAGGVSASSLLYPQSVAVDSAHIFVSDAGNHRVLIFDTLSPKNGQAADWVLGQPTFTENNLRGTSASTLAGPAGITVDNGRLFVADSTANRLLMWQQIPQKHFAPADKIYGQTNAMGELPNPGGLSISTLYSPSQILFTTNGIYIADSNNGRIVALPPGSL